MDNFASAVPQFIFDHDLTIDVFNRWAEGELNRTDDNDPVRLVALRLHSMLTHESVDAELQVISAANEEWTLRPNLRIYGNVLFSDEGETISELVEGFIAQSGSGTLWFKGWSEKPIKS